MWLRHTSFEKDLSRVSRVKGFSTPPTHQHARAAAAVCVPPGAIDECTNEWAELMPSVLRAGVTLLSTSFAEVVRDLYDTVGRARYHTPFLS